MKQTPLILGPLILRLYVATFMLLCMLLGGCSLYGDDSAATDVQVSIEQSIEQPTELGYGAQETAAPSGQSTGEETEGGADASDEDIVEGIAGGGLLIALVGVWLYAGAHLAFAARQEFRFLRRRQSVVTLGGQRLL